MSASGTTPPPDDAAPSVTAVIVAYNSAKYLKRCLDCLAASEGVALEIVVVDNASGDASAEIAEQHPAVGTLLRSKRNRGFAGGNNLGFFAASGEYVAMVNPDCDVEPETLARLVAPLVRDPSIGATGAKLLYPGENRIQHAGGVMHANATCDHYGHGDADEGQHDAEREVDYVTGALAAFRRAEVVALGGLDEEFFPAYYEESDLCERLRRSGRRIVFVGAARARHWESVELGGPTSPRLAELLFRGRMRYLVKNVGIRGFLGKVLPCEIKWWCRPHPRGNKVRVLRSYFHGALFALKCLARFNRRPRGVLPRLPSSE